MMENGKKIVILGLGGAGVRTVATLQNLPEAAELAVYAFDTDRGALERAANIPEDHKILGDAQWLSGLGTGGDVMKGQRAMTRESARMRDLLLGAELVVVTGGLGGGTATGAACVLARLVHTAGVPTVFLFELPFAFEGHGRRKAAEEGTRELVELSATVLSIPNDLLFEVLPAETPFADAFSMADVELAKTILGVVDVVTPGNLLAADLGDLGSLLKSRKSFASIGVGTGHGEPGTACRQALAMLADSPFLGGANKLKDADAVLLNLSGSRALTLSEVKRTLDAAGALPGISARLVVGAGVRENMDETVRLTAIAIKFDEREQTDRQVKSESGKTRRSRRKAGSEDGDLFQQALPLPMPTAGIFEGRTETIEGGVNLDIPTFVRKQIAIDTGE